jgi:hypothetical protein
MSTDLVPSYNYPNFVSGPNHHLNSFHDYLEICKLSHKVAIIELKEPSHLKGVDLGDKGVIDKPMVADGDEGTGYLLPQGNAKNEDYLDKIYQEIQAVGMLQQCKIISF